MYTDEQNWELDSTEQFPFDPLLGCLVILTKHYDHPYSELALVSGLPLVNHKLDPALFVRAAERANLSAKLVEIRLQDLQTNLLPAVILLKDNHACVITKLNDDNSVEVIHPETGEGTETTSLDELDKIYTGHILFAKPIHRFDDRAEAPTQTPTKGWFWKVIRQATPIYSEILIASFLINLFAVASPLFIMNVYDRVVPNSAIETLWVLAFGVSLAIFFEFLMRSVRSYFIDNTGKNIDMQLSRIIFERLLGIEMGSRPKSVGAMVNSIHAFESFREFITSATISTLADAPFIFVFLLVITLIAGNVVIIPLILIPVMLSVSFLIQIPLQKLIYKSFQHTSEKQAVLIESLACTETIKGARAEGPMQRRWEAVSNAAAKSNIKTRFFSNLASNVTSFIQHIGTISVVIFGVYKIADGDMTMGALIASTILSRRALIPITRMVKLFSSYQNAKSGLLSVDKLMKMKIERPADQPFLHRPDITGAIEFKDVSFSYPGSRINVLENVSFKIKAGEHVGIIGRTGSGKTTIEKLILKLYQPTEGSILIDGTELKQIDPADLRYNIGYVPQDVVLFHGSVKHNIMIGAPHASDDTVLKAANLSGTSNFVNIHPDGFDRQVGERGEMLSGGQRQSIALARAVLLNPPVLVFDEPTNAMDDNTTNTLLQRLKAILPTKTLVLVTHKSTLLTLVDRLIVLDNGKVVADGPKEEVIQKLSGTKAKEKEKEKGKGKPDDKK